MTRYQTLTSLGDDLMKLMAKNIIPVHILDWKVYYEAYLRELEEQQRLHRRSQKSLVAGIVADEFRISSRTMFNIIAFMEGK